MAKKLQLLFYI